MIGKFKKSLRRAIRDQRGMTGLETAIILIAFVTVAAVFGYAVLSAGIFSAEKGKETVYAGLEQAKSSMELKGSVIAYGAPGTDGLINDCETAWTPGTGVAVSLAPGFGGDHSVQFALESTEAPVFAPTLVGSSTVFNGDLTEKTFVNLYVWTDTAITGEGNDLLELHLVDSGSTAQETLALPAIAAESWTLVTLSLANPALDGDIATIDLHYGQVPAADMLICIDNIAAGPPYTHAELIVFTVANAVAGKPIDLAPTPNNVTVISYSDRNTYVPNVNWAVDFVGQNDGDYLLEMGEQAQITVSLGFLDTPVGPNSEFGLQVKPPHGSVITIERTIPANIDAIMDLY